MCVCSTGNLSEIELFRFNNLELPIVSTLQSFCHPDKLGFVADNAGNPKSEGGAREPSSLAAMPGLGPNLRLSLCFREASGCRTATISESGCADGGSERLPSCRRTEQLRLDTPSSRQSDLL